MDWWSSFRLFLFDFDGLLVDTEKGHFAAYNSTLAHYGYAPLGTFSQFIAYAHASSQALQDALHGRYPKLFGTLCWDAFYQKKQEMYREWLEKSAIDLMPGVASLLHSLAAEEKMSAIVTHSCREHIETARGRSAPLQTISRIITREDYDLPKPAPACYNYALRQFPEEAEQAIGFEDSFRGICSLEQTQATSVFIQKKSYPLWEEGAARADIHAPSFSDLSLDLFASRGLLQGKGP
ncbi:MAG: HAD family phosphatase [Chlamydiota bacterium]